MGQHHNPMDPRDPLGPAFYFTFIDRGGNGGRRGATPNGGCGCLLPFLLAFTVGAFIALITSH